MSDNSTINLSILDFKFKQATEKTKSSVTINLSILDFKFH